MLCKDLSACHDWDMSAAISFNSTRLGTKSVSGRTNFRTTDGHEGGQEKRLVSKRRRWFGKNPDNYSSNFANKNLNIELPDDLTNVNF